ncbi:MAG: leucine-rich repeat domain-containing protein [Bacteroidaceae bacterium]|nr:leucine-rich repeat domain-containing protein [Bacteroidaceae bacterium]
MSGPKTSLKAIVDVDVDDATLVYYAFCSLYNYEDRIHYRNELNVYIDGKLVRNVKRDQIACTSYSDNHPWDTDGRFCEKLTKGVHVIEWEYLKNDYNGNSDNDSHISDVGVVKTPLTSVSLLEPGSLGTEILAQVNSVLDVRRLKIKGEMNAEDWNTISLMNANLYSLDLSEAIITEIPDNQFNNHAPLYEIKLPEGLKRIGTGAFYDSHVEQVNFPSTLTTIGKDAFRHSDIKSVLTSHSQLQTIEEYAFDNCRYLEHVTFPKTMVSMDKSVFLNCRHMHTLVFPEKLESMGTNVFAYCDSLRSKIIFPEGMTYVPEYSFQQCIRIDSLVIPNSVTHINQYAFDICTNLKYIDLPDSLLVIDKYAFASNVSLPRIDFPHTLQTITTYGFAYCHVLDSIVVPENTSLGESVFRDCFGWKYAELPTSYYNIASKYIFTNCNNLNRIKIKSPTLLHGYTDEFVSNKGNITLVVPDYLVSSYKLDNYWYTYKDVEGFGTSEVDTWTINNPVTLGATSRFQGSPNVIINRTNLTVNGETGMELNDLNIDVHTSSGSYYSNGTKYYYNQFNSSTQILSSADIMVNGELTLDYYTNANEWAYIALPFDIRVGDIVTDAQYAIRYYDGANRAATLVASGNWKNYTADDIIPAGTGFVYQTSKNAWNIFVAYENTNKNRALAAKDLATPLDVNACETSAHRGWNLVGNPWMTYFNIHAVDFTAPITVYDQYYRKYQAYSIIDDNVALHPTQAFFVQCPDDISSITFPARGRQLTSVVTDQNGARSVSSRRLADVELRMGDVSDQTRVVMNDAATLGYDYGSDAGKFFADEEVIQLYTTDAEGYSYAINERPTDDCTVQLAYIAPSAGEYTLTMPRNQAGQVVLKDLLLNTETVLNYADYTFSADAGTCEDRFLLLFNSIGVMGIEGLQVMPEVNVTEGGLQAKGEVQVYTTDGRLVAEGEGFLPLQQGFYVVRAQGESKKVVIK